MKKPATSETPCQPHVEFQLPLPLLSCLQAVREGFFELCIHVGEQAWHALMEQDRPALCGARWSRDPSRRAGRGGSTASEVTLGGRRIRVRRLRAAQVDGPELALPSFGWAADRDPLDEHTWRSIVAGVSTRSYGASLAPVPNEFQQRSTLRSAVSRRFVALRQRPLTTGLSRPLGDLDLQVVMIDGIDYHDHTILVALGIDARGTKHVLGVREGTTENSAVAGALLSDVVDRGLAVDQPLLFVIAGGTALRKAIRRVFGAVGVVQRCQVPKLRNVLEHLPEDLRPSVRHAMRQAYDAATPAASAQRPLERLARSWDADHPGAAAFLTRRARGDADAPAGGHHGGVVEDPAEHQSDRESHRRGGKVHAQRPSLAQRVNDSPVGRVRAPRRRAAVSSCARGPRDARPDRSAASARHHQR